MEKYIDAPITPAITGKAASATAGTPIEPAVASAATAEPVITPPQDPASSKTQKQQLPQDSILRRHYLTQLRFDFESTLPPSPTDSILKRHYGSLLANEMAKRLEELQS